MRKAFHRRPLLCRRPWCSAHCVRMRSPCSILHANDDWAGPESTKDLQIFSPNMYGVVLLRALSTSRTAITGAAQNGRFYASRSIRARPGSTPATIPPPCWSKISARHTNEGLSKVEPPLEECSPLKAGHEDLRD